VALLEDPCEMLGFTLVKIFKMIIYSLCLDHLVLEM